MKCLLCCTRLALACNTVMFCAIKIEKGDSRISVEDMRVALEAADKAIERYHECELGAQLVT